VAELPSLAEIDPRLGRQLLTTPASERIWVLLESLCSDGTLAIIDQLDADSITALLSEWEQLSDIAIGELVQLFRIIRRHGEALEADLIKAQMRLRWFPCADHNWHDLKVFIRYLDRHSALYAAMHPEHAGWDTTNMLLADVVDSVHWLQWAKTEDGVKGRNKPKKVPRPGVVQPQREGAKPRPIQRSLLKQRYEALRGSVRETVMDKAERIKQIFSEGG